MVKEIKIMAPKHDKGKKIIQIDGEKFILDKATESQIHDILHFKKLESQKEYEKTLDEMAEKISKKTNVKKLIKQALYEIPFEVFLTIKKELEKEEPTIRNSEGCVFLRIGKAKLFLRD